MLYLKCWGAFLELGPLTRLKMCFSEMQLLPHMAPEKTHKRVTYVQVLKILDVSEGFVVVLFVREVECFVS